MDLVALALPHVMLEHCSEHSRPGTQHRLVTLQDPVLALYGNIGQGAGVKQSLHVRDDLGAVLLLLLLDLSLFLINETIINPAIGNSIVNERK